MSTKVQHPHNLDKSSVTGVWLSRWVGVPSNITALPTVISGWEVIEIRDRVIQVVIVSAIDGEAVERSLLNSLLHGHAHTYTLVLDSVSIRSQDTASQKNCPCPYGMCSSYTTN